MQCQVGCEQETDRSLELRRDLKPASAVNVDPGSSRDDESNARI
jgi:hypothetical protein